MPKLRKPLRLTYTPPTRPGWYAYKHVHNDIEAVYLGKSDLEDAQSRYQMALLFDFEPADIWSTRKLKKRERGGGRVAKAA